MLWCQTDLEYSYLLWNCYYSGVLRISTSVGTKSMESISLNQVVVHMNLGAVEQLPVSVTVFSSMHGSFEWSHHLLAATSCIRTVWGPSYRQDATLCSWWKWWLRHNKKKRILRRHQPKCLQRCTVWIFVVNAHNKLKIKNWTSMASFLSGQLVSRWVTGLAIDKSVCRMTFSYSLNRRRNCCPSELHMLSVKSPHMHFRRLNGCWVYAS